jgi:hypothetical protein
MCHRKFGGLIFSQACILTLSISAGPEKVDPTNPANPPATNFTINDVSYGVFPFDKKFLHGSYVPSLRVE